MAHMSVVKHSAVDVARLRTELRLAQEIADEASQAAIECHGIRGEDGYIDVRGEPVEGDVAYLESRGLLERHPVEAMLVRLLNI
jgi:hypothetical protein